MIFRSFRIGVLCFGEPAPWSRDAVSHWLERARSLANVSLRFLEPRGRVTKEELLRRAGDFPIALTRQGVPLDSQGWARMLQRFMLEGVEPAFVVGPPDGLPEEFIEACKRSISLGPLTLQHEIALLVLLEQIYRALSICAGLPYHRG